MGIRIQRQATAHQSIECGKERKNTGARRKVEDAFQSNYARLKAERLAREKLLDCGGLYLQGGRQGRVMPAIFGAGAARSREIGRFAS